MDINVDFLLQRRGGLDIVLFAGGRIRIQIQAARVLSLLFPTFDLWLVVLGHLQGELRLDTVGWPLTHLLTSPVTGLREREPFSLAGAQSHCWLFQVSWEFWEVQGFDASSHTATMSTWMPALLLGCFRISFLEIQGETPTFHPVGIPGPSVCGSHSVK